MSTNPKDPQAELREAIEEILRPDRTDYFIKQTTDQIMQLFQAREQKMLTELLGELETPVYPETMAYVEMVKKASENGKYDDMFDNGFKAARSVIEKYRERL